MPATGIIRTAQQTGENIRSGTAPRKIRRRRPSGKGNASIRSIGLCSVKFDDRKALEIHPVNEPEYGFKEKDMYEQLYKAYSHYCKLLKIKPCVSVEDGNYKDGIYRVYHTVLSIIQKENRHAAVNIEYDHHLGYHFTVYASYFFGDTIFVYPLELLYFLERSKSKLYQPLLLFSKKMVTTIGFTDWDDNGHLGYIPEMLLEHAAELAEDEPESALSMIHNSNQYSREGVATNYIRKLYNAKGNLDNKLKASLRRMKLNNKHEEDLRTWILEGIDLMNDKAADNIMSFQWRLDPDEVETEASMLDERGVELEKQFVIVWSEEDHVFHDYLETLNMDHGEFGGFQPMDWHYITTETKKPYRKPEWLHKVKTWLNFGMSKFSLYCEEKRKTKLNNERFDQAYYR